MFQFQLVRPEVVQPLPWTATDDGYAYEDYVMDACMLMDESRAGFRFVLRGFGRDDWPVNVRTDLSTFLEDLPRIQHELALGGTFVIELYEQGIQARLTFSPAAATSTVRCESFGDWQPSPDTELVATTKLVEMFEALAWQFVASVDSVSASPELARAIRHELGFDQ